MSKINCFTGKYFFLSNFYEAPVIYNGVCYGSNEAAYQAQKTTDENKRLEFHSLNPSRAKSLGRRLILRPDWEDIKTQVMYEICFAKFTQNKHLGNKLIETGNSYLEEGNTWGDKVWGTVDGDGENRLGEILMKVREQIREFVV